MADKAFPDKKRKRVEKLNELNESIVSHYDGDGNPILAEVNISRVKEDKTTKVIKSRLVILEEHQEAPENTRYLEWDPAGDTEAQFPHPRQQQPDPAVPLPTPASSAGSVNPALDETLPLSAPFTIPSNLRNFNNPGLREQQVSPSKDYVAQNTRRSRLRLVRPEEEVSRRKKDEANQGHPVDSSSIENPDKSNSNNSEVAHNSTPVPSPVPSTEDTAFRPQNDSRDFAGNNSDSFASNLLSQGQGQQTQPELFQEQSSDANETNPGTDSTNPEPSGFEGTGQDLIDLSGASGSLLRSPPVQESDLSTTDTAREEDPSGSQTQDQRLRTPQGQLQTSQGQANAQTPGEVGPSGSAHLFPQQRVARGDSDLFVPGDTSLQGPETTGTPEAGVSQIPTEAGPVESVGEGSGDRVPEGEHQRHSGGETSDQQLGVGATTDRFRDDSGSPVQQLRGLEGEDLVGSTTDGQGAEGLPGENRQEGATPQQVLLPSTAETSQGNDPRASGEVDGDTPNTTTGRTTGLLARAINSVVRPFSGGTGSVVRFKNNRSSSQEPLLFLPGRRVIQGSLISQRLGIDKRPGRKFLQDRTSPYWGVGHSQPSVHPSTAGTHSTSFSSSIAGTAGGVSTGENSQSTGETGGAVGGAGLQVNSTSAPVSTTSEQVPPSRRVGVPANPSRSSRENHRNLSGDQEEALPRLHREGASSLPSLLPSSLQETAGRAPTTITPPSPNQPPEGLPPVSNLDVSFMEAMGRTEFRSSARNENAGYGGIVDTDSEQPIELHLAELNQQFDDDLWMIASLASRLKEGSPVLPNADVDPVIEDIFRIVIFGGIYTNDQDLLDEQKTKATPGYPRGPRVPGQTNQYYRWLLACHEDFINNLFFFGYPDRRPETEDPMYREGMMLKIPEKEKQNMAYDRLKYLFLPNILASLKPKIQAARRLAELRKTPTLPSPRQIAAPTTFHTTQASSTSGTNTTPSPKKRQMISSTAGMNASKPRTPTESLSSDEDSGAKGPKTKAKSPGSDEGDVDRLLWVEDLPHLSKTVPPAFSHPGIEHFKVTNQGEGQYTYQPDNPKDVLNMTRLGIQPLPNFPTSVVKYTDSSIGVRQPYPNERVRLYQYAGRVRTQYPLLVFQVDDPESEENHPVVKLRKVLQQHSSHWMQMNNFADVMVPNLERQLDRRFSNLTDAEIQDISNEIKQVKTTLANLNQAGKQIDTFIIQPRPYNLVRKWNEAIIEAYESQLDNVFNRMLDLGVEPEVVNRMKIYTATAPAATFTQAVPTEGMENLSLNGGGRMVNYNYPQMSLPVWNGDRRCFGDSWAEFELAVDKVSDAKIPPNVKMQYLRKFVQAVPEEYLLANNNYRSTKEGYDSYKAYLLKTYKMTSKELATSFLRSVQQMPNLTAERDDDSYSEYHRLNKWIQDLEWIIKKYRLTAGVGYDHKYWWMILERKIKPPFKARWEQFKDRKFEENEEFMEQDMVKEFIDWSHRQMALLKSKGERERLDKGNFSMNLADSFPIFSVAKNRAVTYRDNPGKRQGGNGGGGGSGKKNGHRVNGGNTTFMGHTTGKGVANRGKKNTAPPRKGTKGGPARPSANGGKINKTFNTQTGRPVKPKQQKGGPQNKFKQTVPRSCLNCNDKSHTIRDCKKDLNYKYASGHANHGGYVLFYDNSLCYKCGQQYHRPDQCKSARPCGIDNCQREHCPFLHNFDFLGYNTYRDRYPQQAERAKKNMENALNKSEGKRKAPQSSLNSKKKK